MKKKRSWEEKREEKSQRRVSQIFLFARKKARSTERSDLTNVETKRKITMDHVQQQWIIIE